MYITYDMHRKSPDYCGNREVILVSDESTPDTIIDYVNKRRNSYDLKPLGVSPQLCDKAKERADQMRDRPLPTSYTRQMIALEDKSLLESGEYLDLILSGNCLGLGISSFSQKIDNAIKNYTVQVLTFRKN